jgi:hypothetical protein
MKSNFTKIESKQQLFQLIKEIHTECYRLSFKSFGRYFDNAGNIGIFCHYDDEYELLTQIRNELCIEQENPRLKYYTLKNPIIFESDDGIPAAKYTHLYIRKPDPTDYGKHAGDIDFFLNDKDYLSLLNRFKSDQKNSKGASLYEYNGAEMIEIASSLEGALAYISTKEIAEGMRFKKTNI